MSEQPPFDPSTLVTEEAPALTDDVIVPQPENVEEASDEQLSPSERLKRRMASRNSSRATTDDSSRAGTQERTRERKAKQPKVIPPKPREGALVKPLTELYVTIGITTMAFDPVCGQAIVANAEACAKSLDTLARENPAVRRAILALVQTSAWGGVVAAHLPLLLMVAMHHGPKNMQESLGPVAMMMNGGMPNPAGEDVA